MNQKTIITAIVALILYGAMYAVAGFYVGEGCKKCPVCPEIRDSVKQAPACTVKVPSDKIVIRQKIDTIVKIDTLKMIVTRNDTNTIADIPDTTMPDGAKIGVQIKAKLIIPPASATIWYTPAPDTAKHVIYPPVIINHRFGIGPSIGYGINERGERSGYMGLSLNWNILTF